MMALVLHSPRCISLLSKNSARRRNQQRRKDGAHDQQSSSNESPNASLSFASWGGGVALSQSFRRENRYGAFAVGTRSGESSSGLFSEASAGCDVREPDETGAANAGATGELDGAEADCFART